MNPYWALLKQFWPLIVSILLGLVIALFGHYKYNAGKHDVQAKWDQSIKRGQVIVDGLKVRQREITTVTETVYKDRIKVIHEKGDTIVKQVPIFVRGDPDLSGGFRVFYDAAATNTLPDSASVFDASPVAAADVATTSAKNFNQYYEVKTRLEGLQTWLRQQHELYLEKCRELKLHCSADKF